MKKSAIICLAGSVLAVSGAALAVPPGLPHQKVGLWQQTMARDGTTMSAASSQVCFDAAAEDKMSVFGQQMANKMCQSQKVVHNLDGSWSSDSTCSLGSAMTISGHTVVTGDFNSKITITTISMATGAPVTTLNGRHQIVITATWLGPCKAGQRGGDMIMSNGMKINMMDTLNGMHSGTPAH